jgi:hypothetical protein
MTQVTNGAGDKGLTLGCSIKLVYLPHTSITGDQPAVVESSSPLLTQRKPGSRGIEQPLQ